MSKFSDGTHSAAAFPSDICTLVLDIIGGVQCTDPIEPEPPQNAADRCRRQPQLDGDLLAGTAPPAKGLHLLDNGLRGWSVNPMGSGTAIAQPCHAFTSISINPLANGPRADACGFGNGLRRLPAQDLSDNSLSTNRRETGILMNVHPVLRGTLKLRNLSFLGPGRMDNLLKAHT
jgi:hypothetical protein